MMNFALILLVISGFIIGLLLYFRRQNAQGSVGHKVIKESEQYQFEQLVTYVKEAINDLTRTNLYELGLSEEAFKRRLNKRSELKKALKNCTYGSIHDKEYVKDFIQDLLRKDYVTSKTVDQIMPFTRPQFLSSQDKFEVILYCYKKSHGYDAMAKLIEANNLDRLKYVIEEGNTASYIITAEEIEDIYRKMPSKLTYEDKLAVITQRVYQTYKGFGVVDELRDMNIDGISGGVSGAVDMDQSFDLAQEGNLNQFQQSTGQFDSVWIFYKGKSIHLSYLTFGSENELRRICQNIYRYNKAGQLSESAGYKINEMKDGSRVVVVRPTFAESWAFFVRKFHIVNVTLEELIQDEGCHLPIEMLKYLVKGARITSITGSQGSGKTTMLMAMVRSIYATLTLRVQEMAFELHLRKVYPMRNILTFKETSTISGQAGLDVQKKTDGSVNILGEVATDEVAVWMLQMAQVASLFTLFTHHAKTVKDLSLSLRNSLLKCDVFRDEKIAEEQVVNVLDFDVHLERDENGKRYISRITEIIALDQDIAYPETYKNVDKMATTEFMDTMTEYFRRRTDRKIYLTNNVIEFEEGRYVAKGLISKDNIAEMKRLMNQEDREGFQHYLNENWGEGA